MARGIDRTELLELLAETVNNENPMLHLMEFFLGHLMEAEVEVIVGADRSERTEKRKNYRSGYRDRRFDTRLGSMDLKIPKLRTGGYVPCFLRTCLVSICNNSNECHGYQLQSVMSQPFTIFPKASAFIQPFKRAFYYPSILDNSKFV